MRPPNGAFVACWTLAVVAATAAFCVHLTVRVRAIELGYELGRVHAQLTRLREVKRVLELEVASYETPERVDLVARTLLGMAPPGADRVLHAAPLPKVLDAEREAGGGLHQQLARATRGGGESVEVDDGTREDRLGDRALEGAGTERREQGTQAAPGIHRVLLLDFIERENRA